MDEHVPAQLKQPLQGDVCDVGPGVVMKEADGLMVWELVLSLTGQTIQFFAVQVFSESEIE